MTKALKVELPISPRSIVRSVAPTVRIDVFDKLVVTNFFSQLGSPNPFFGTASEFEEHNGAAHSRPNNDVRPFARWVNMRRKDDFLALVINKKIPIVCFGEESFLCLGPGLRKRWFLARTNKVVGKSFRASGRYGFSLVQLSDEFLKGGFNVGKYRVVSPIVTTLLE